RSCMSDYTTLETEARARIEAAADLVALEALRVEYLGKQGSISALLKTLGAMSPEERLEKAPRIQHLREAVAGALAERKAAMEAAELEARLASERDRKSTRLNSSHVKISYAVFCLKKKKAVT